ncbi:MAG: NUDIX domain-containing protein [Janthinobacterium lividum]
MFCILLAYDPRSKPHHYYELNKSFYYLPGGHINSQESSQQAVLREINEETGHTGECERLLGIFEYSWNFPGDGVCCHTYEINFIFKINMPTLDSLVQASQQEDHVALKWIKLEELNSTDFRPIELKLLLSEWLSLDLNNVLKTSII